VKDLTCLAVPYSSAVQTIGPLAVEIRMTLKRPGSIDPEWCRRLSQISLTLVLLLLPASCPADVDASDVVQGTAAVRPIGPEPIEFASEFSRILLEEQDDVRVISFIRDNGEIVVETKMNIRQPHRLIVPYTQWMFAAYLFVPAPANALIVGLGGGSMVRFLEHYDPDLQVDAVEIDPVMVRIAKEYFGTADRKNVRIVTADAFEYLRSTPRIFDVIYMDAFLKPSEKTDSTGVPLDLKDAAFYGRLRHRLRSGGVVVFNLNLNEQTRDDEDAIAKAFPQVYSYYTPNSGNLIVVASTARERVSTKDQLKAARILDARFRADFSFVDIVKSQVR
jgi:spermidine synthase